jgi:Cation transporter/ATPase, N-terminus/Cation transporting ATPase, C-terminus
MNAPGGTADELRFAWHAASDAVVLARLRAPSEGLTVEEARTRLAAYGRNDLPEQRRISLAAILLRQFKSPLIYVLGVAAALAGALEDLKDALFIVGVLAINAVLGGYQEFKAERSSLALRRLLKIRASVPFRRSPVLLLGIAAALIIHVAAMHSAPGHALLETAPVSGDRWVGLALLASTVFVAIEAHKVYWQGRVRTNADGRAKSVDGA